MSNKYILLILALLSFQSCAWEEDLSRLQAPSWQGEIAAPIAQGYLSIGDILDQLGELSFLRVQPDGELILHSELPLARWALPTQVELPDFSAPFLENTTMQVPFPVAGITTFVNQEGSLLYHFSYSGEVAIRVDFRLRELIQAGQETRLSVEVPGPGTYEGSFDISGSAFAPRDGQLSMSYAAYEPFTETPHSLDQVVLTFSGLRLSYAEGTFPPTLIVLAPDTLHVQLDLNMDFPDIILSEPQITFVVESQIGLPNQFSFPRFSFLFEDGRRQDLSYEPLSLGSSLEVAPTPKQWVETRFTLTRENSNIADLLNQGIPSALAYDASLDLFPYGKTTPGFITDLDSIRVRVEAESPLAFQLREYAFRHELDINLEMVDLIRSANLSISTQNGIPLELDLQVYLADESGIIQDSLFLSKARLLAGAQMTGADGTTEPATQLLQVDFSEARLPDLSRAKRMVLEARVSSTQHGEVPVRITKDQTLAFQLGAKVR